MSPRDKGWQRFLTVSVMRMQTCSDTDGFQKSLKQWCNQPSVLHLHYFPVPIFQLYSYRFNAIRKKNQSTENDSSVALIKTKKKTKIKIKIIKNSQASLIPDNLKKIYTSFASHKIFNVRYFMCGLFENIKWLDLINIFNTRNWWSRCSHSLIHSLTFVLSSLSRCKVVWGFFNHNDTMFAVTISRCNLFIRHVFSASEQEALVDITHTGNTCFFMLLCNRESGLYTYVYSIMLFSMC